MQLPKEELQVTPSKNNKVGWSFICYSGIEVFKKADCQSKKFKDWPPITTKNGLKSGDIVYTNVFGTVQEGIVFEANGELYVDAGPNVTNLIFDGDDRHCWSTNSAFNIKAVMRVKLPR